MDELPCCTEPLLPGWLTCTDGEVDEVCDESPGESGVVVVLSLPLVLLSPLGDASGCVVDEGSALLTGTVVDCVDASLCESPGLLDGDAANAGVAERISMRNARSATTRLARRSWQERRDESRAPLRKALPKTTTCRRTLSPHEDPIAGSHANRQRDCTTLPRPLQRETRGYVRADEIGRICNHSQVVLRRVERVSNVVSSTG
ncbi:MAG TPA: hypothetical protein VEH52_13960 [Gaiellaceae bacterium]|nr:hypothetical protein [Gaiellaceae bacterium]